MLAHVIVLLCVAGMGLLILLGGIVSARGRAGIEKLHQAKVCPQCGLEEAMLVDIGKLTVPEGSDHPPGMCTLYFCKSCGAKLKRHLQQGQWLEPDEDELLRFPTAEYAEGMQMASRSTQPTGVGMIAFLGSWVVSAFAAFRIGVYSYLLYWYGPRAIISEIIYIVDTSKGQPWSVSNGEQIPNGEWFAALVGIPLTFVFFFVLYALIDRFLPWELERPLDDATREAQSRSEAAGERALVLVGAIILLASLSMLCILWLIV